MDLKDLDYVDYEEFARNVYNPSWQGWKTIAKIESKCKPSYYYRGNVVAHAICFLNNYFLEKAIKEAMDLEFYGEDHDKWYCYSGVNTPDFIDKNGVTYELKQMKDLDRLYSIPIEDWHNCDIKLAYIRMSDALYKYDNKLKTWKLVKHIYNIKHINPLKALTDYEVGIK